LRARRRFFSLRGGRGGEGLRFGGFAATERSVLFGQKTNKSGMSRLRLRMGERRGGRGWFGWLLQSVHGDFYLFGLSIFGPRIIYRMWTWRRRCL